MCWHIVSSQDEIAKKKEKRNAMWNVKCQGTWIHNHRRRHFRHSETVAVSPHMIWMNLELNCSETQEFVIITYPLVGVWVCVFMWGRERESLRGIMTLNWSGWSEWPGTDWDVNEPDTYSRWMWKTQSSEEGRSVSPSDAHAADSSLNFFLLIGFYFNPTFDLFIFWSADPQPSC